MPQVGDAEARRRAWISEGNAPCEHASVSKEYYLGADTGDYVCDNCGESGVGRAWPERERAETAKRIDAAIAVLKREEIEATRKLIELRRDQHVQRVLAAHRAGNHDEAAKASGSRDACETMLADLLALEAELPR